MPAKETPPKQTEPSSKQGKQPIRIETFDPEAEVGKRGRNDGDLTQGGEGVDDPPARQ